MLPFADESYDVIVSSELLVHLRNWRDFLREWKRVLKKGGYIITNIHNGDHLKRISDNEVEQSFYISPRCEYFSSVTREELETTCREIGELEIVERIPYGFGYQTALFYDKLTKAEMWSLHSLYMYAASNEETRDVISAFEEQIVQKQNPEMCLKNMLILRKTSEPQGAKR